MAALLYHIFSSSALVSLGLYHLICTTRNYLKSPHTYSAKPFHPFPPSSSSSSSSSSGNGGRLRHLQLYLLIICLLIAMTHQLIISVDADPLLKGRTPVHRFNSLQSVAVLFLFFLISISLLLTDSSSLLPFPSDLFFALASAFFFLQYNVSSSAASVQTSDLQAKCDSVSAGISALASLLCLVLACQSRLFVADIGLAAAICLQGLWVLQTGLSLYVDAFIPDGCHRLLDVVNGVEGSTQCDLEESKFRAVALLDLVFLVHVMFVLLIVMITYAGLAKNISIRRLGSYEALPTAAAVSENNHSHIQMKAMTGTQA
ncbi:putative Transmembrane protein [Quillaja saponaria]|uniref:Transmembrane protein n=1 Tax=Quillaja saponaria TaxID=32244 RepID=A0AAD7PZ29_QUISA|nr:putative Transmembrane protein [Quillaja saponaria]